MQWERSSWLIEKLISMWYFNTIKQHITTEIHSLIHIDQFTWIELLAWNIVNFQFEEFQKLGKNWVAVSQNEGTQDKKYYRVSVALLLLYCNSRCKILWSFYGSFKLHGLLHQNLHSIVIKMSTVAMPFRRQFNIFSIPYLFVFHGYHFLSCQT